MIKGHLLTFACFVIFSTHKFFHFRSTQVIEMSNWHNLIRSDLTVSEKQYFRAKAVDGMCFTQANHRCFVGMQ